MSDVLDFTAGGYRYIKGMSQYSGGVSALPGYRLERVRFHQPVPLKKGFEKIASRLNNLGLPLTAFAGCELRSPEPFSEEGFVAFNAKYTEPLKEWGLLATGNNPVARSNVCPKVSAPSEPSFFAFTYCVPDAGSGPSFVVSGSAEVPEGHAAYRDHIIRRGDLSEDGLREKAQYVLKEMEDRMAKLGFGWSDATAAQIYTVHNIHPFLEDELVARGAAKSGLSWHYNNPPVVDLEYEMDCRRIAHEYVI